MTDTISPVPPPVTDYMITNNASWQLWAYQGQRQNGMNMQHRWRDESGTIRTFTIEKKDKGKCFDISPCIGGRYWVALATKEGGGTTVCFGGSNGPHYLDRPLSDEVATWTALDLAARKAAKRAKEQKDEQSFNALHDSLDPAREAYTKASWQQRADILAEVIRYITSGR